MLFIHLILIFVAYLSCFSPISSFLIQIRLLWLFRVLFSLFLTDDWSNIAKLPKSHDDPQTHQDSCVNSEKTLYRLSVEKKDICQDISSSHNQLVTKNRAIFKVIAETVILCGQQNFTLRGNDEEKSNFKALLRYKAKDNTILADHLENGDSRTKYPPGFNCWFSFAPVFQWCCSTPQGSPGIGSNTLFLSSSHL